MIAPINPLPSLPSLPSVGAAGTGGGAGTTGAGAATGGGTTTGLGATGGPGSFGSAVTNAINQVQQTQANASTLAAQAAAGQGNIADALIASTQASLATQVTTAVTNKAITAFTEVMNMQI